MRCVTWSGFSKKFINEILFAFSHRCYLSYLLSCFRPSIHPSMLCLFDLQKIISIKFGSTNKNIYETEWNETKRQHASCIRGFYLFMDWMCNLYGFQAQSCVVFPFVFSCVCVFSLCWWFEYYFSIALVLFICLGWLVLSALKFWYTIRLQYIHRMHHRVCITISTIHSS